MSVPKVSVIVPFWNAERYLAQALECMEKIQFHSWELIFIDDGSTDDGLDLLTRLSKDSSLQVNIVRNFSSLGAGQARNEGVRAASGDYVWFADCDDKWSEDILTHFWSGIVNDSVDVVICDLEKVHETTGGRQVVRDAPSKEVIDGPQAFTRVLSGNLQGHLVNKLIRRDLLVRHPLPSLRAHEDLGCLLEVFWAAQTVSLVPGVMYSYVLRGGSLMQSPEYRWEDLLEVSTIVDNLIAKEPSSSIYRKRLNEFRISHILIPAASAMAARSRVDLGRLPFVEKVTIGTIFSLLVHKRWLLAARTVLLKAAPGIYGVIQNKFVGPKVLLE